MWEKIDELEPFVRRIFYYKFDFRFNKIRSNHSLCECNYVCF